jgi:hypothetical protein
MKKVLIIGDSHTACLKQAENAVSKDFNVELHFLVAMGANRGCFIFNEKGISISEKPNWAERKNKAIDEEWWNKSYDRLIGMFKTIENNNLVRYSDYSAIILVGGGFLRSWEQYVVNTSIYSQSFLIELFVQKYAEHWHGWLKSLNKVGGLDVYCCSMPLRNELDFENVVADEIRIKSVKSFMDTEDFVSYGISCLGATYVPLPESLLSIDKNSTKAEFQPNSGDMSHLNLNGGEIRLRDLLEKVMA